MNISTLKPFEVQLHSLTIETDQLEASLVTQLADTERLRVTRDEIANDVERLQAALEAARERLQETDESLQGACERLLSTASDYTKVQLLRKRYNNVLQSQNGGQRVFVLVHAVDDLDSTTTTTKLIEGGNAYPCQSPKRSQYSTNNRAATRTKGMKSYPIISSNHFSTIMGAPAARHSPVTIADDCTIILEPVGPIQSMGERRSFVFDEVIPFSDSALGACFERIHGEELVKNVVNGVNVVIVDYGQKDVLGGALFGNLPISTSFHKFTDTSTTIKGGNNKSYFETTNPRYYSPDGLSNRLISSKKDSKSSFSPKNSLAETFTDRLFAALIGSDIVEFHVQLSMFVVHEDIIFDVFARDQSGMGYKQVNPSAVQVNSHRVVEISDLTYVTVRDCKDALATLQEGLHHVSHLYALKKSLRGGHIGLEFKVETYTRGGSYYRGRIALFSLVGFDAPCKNQEDMWAEQSLAQWGEQIIASRDDESEYRRRFYSGIQSNHSLDRNTNRPVDHSSNTVLTRLLADVYGGNCKAVLLCEVIPKVEGAENTQTALLYGEHSKASLYNHIEIFHIPSDIQKLNHEITTLRIHGAVNVA